MTLGTPLTRPTLTSTTTPKTITTPKEMPIATGSYPTGNLPHRQSWRSDSIPNMEHFRVPDIPPAAYYVPDFITADEEDYILRKLAESPQPKWKTVGSGRRLQYWGGTMSKGGVLVPEQLPDFLTTFPDIIQRIERFLDTPDATVLTGHSKSLSVNQVLVNEYQPGQGISPHEDGPAFHPLVATVSLGSHTVLDIHHYLSSTQPSPPMTATETVLVNESDNLSGRPIAAIPLAHLLLLPRSLLILSSSLYTSHLHAIASNDADVIRQAEEAKEEGAIVVANEKLLGDANVLDALVNKGEWVGSRGVRTSLTFRQAEKVLKGGSFSIAMGKLRRT